MGGQGAGHGLACARDSPASPCPPWPRRCTRSRRREARALRVAIAAPSPAWSRPPWPCGGLAQGSPRRRRPRHARHGRTRAHAGLAATCLVAPVPSPDSPLPPWPREARAGLTAPCLATPAPAATHLRSASSPTRDSPRTCASPLVPARVLRAVDAGAGSGGVRDRSRPPLLRRGSPELRLLPEALLPLLPGGAPGLLPPRPRPRGAWPRWRCCSSRRSLASSSRRAARAWSYRAQASASSTSCRAASSIAEVRMTAWSCGHFASSSAANIISAARRSGSSSEDSGLGYSGGAGCSNAALPREASPMWRPPRFPLARIAGGGRRLLLASESLAPGANRRLGAMAAVRVSESGEWSGE
nr:uncharacterized protein LOC127346868 [Lolium perenne]